MCSKVDLLDSDGDDEIECLRGPFSLLGLDVADEDGDGDEVVAESMVVVRLGEVHGLADPPAAATAAEYQRSAARSEGGRGMDGNGMGSERRRFGSFLHRLGEG